MATVNKKMTEIADNIRWITADSERKLGLDDIIYELSNTIYPAYAELSGRIRGEVGMESLRYYVDQAINDFDNIKAAIEAQGLDVSDIDTYGMAELIGTACENKRAKGIEEGKQALNREFWRIYQSRSNGNFMFAGSGWNTTTFHPIYPIDVTRAAYMFHSSGIKDLAGYLETNNIEFDVSNATTMIYMFSLSSLVHIPVIDTTSAGDNTEKIFYGCSSLTTIDLFRLKDDGSQTFAKPFLKCNVLQQITIEGVIGNSISFEDSPLNKESITSVINALSATATGKTLTLKKTAVDNAFGINVNDETTYPEGSEYYTLRHSKDNWTFSYK